jgi:hypothetical protein
MKLSHVVLAFALLMSTAFAQVNFQSEQGTGVVTTKPDGRLLITARAASIQGIPVVGHFQVDLPALASGDYQNGGVFAAGGIFEMIISGPVPYKYTGTIQAGGQWVAGNDGNPYYNYYVSFVVISPQGTAGCGFQSNTLTAPFAGSLTIDYAMTCNTDVTQPETKKSAN